MRRTWLSGRPSLARICCTAATARGVSTTTGVSAGETASMQARYERLPAKSTRNQSDQGRLAPPPRFGGSELAVSPVRASLRQLSWQACIVHAGASGMGVAALKGRSGFPEHALDLVIPFARRPP